MTAFTVTSTTSCKDSELREDFDLKTFRFSNETEDTVLLRAFLNNPDSLLRAEVIPPGGTLELESASWGGLAPPFSAPCCRDWYVDRVQFESVRYGCTQFSDPQETRTTYAEGEGPFNGLNYQEYDPNLSDDQQPAQWTYLIDSTTFAQGTPCR